MLILLPKAQSYEITEARFKTQVYIYIFISRLPSSQFKFHLLYKAVSTKPQVIFELLNKTVLYN